ncbi:MAG: response regulator [bacterium]
MTENKQLAAIENAFDGIALLDEKGIYQYMNVAHANLFGYDSDQELIGQSWKSIYTDDYAAKLEAEVFPLLEVNGNWSGETIGISKDRKPVLQYISLTKLPDGGLICICRENSNSINAAKLQYLMGNLGKSVLVEDEHHRIVLVNKEFCNLFKIPFEPEDLIGADCLNALDQSLHLFKDPLIVKQQITEMTGRQDAVIGSEVVFSDGRILERDYVPIIIGNNFKGQLWSYTDVTQNRQLQQSLLDAKNRAVASEKAKSAFLSTMSHEIRTPMNAIIGFAEQLSFSKLNSEQSFFVKNITDAANGLLGVINDILDLSRIEAGKMNIEKEIINLRSIISSVENILKPKAEEKGLQFNTHVSETIKDRLFADEVRIRQILINIVGNAIKFTERGFVKLNIELVDQNDQKQVLKIICEDSGIGISQESLSRVFDDFFQESNGGDHRSNGSGLGLAITKTLIDLMGGNIDIVSNKGVGTIVVMKIPFELVTDDSLVVEHNTADELNLIENKKILLVEDNKLNRLVFKMMLNNMNAEVHEVENGLEAVNKLSDTIYDLVLMDIQMPVMDGTTALHIIKKKYGESIPVIALTAAAFNSEVTHMLNLGFSDCITKPIDQKNLQTRLYQFFRNGSAKEKYYQTLQKEILVNINQMANGDNVQVSRLIGYLLEEVNFSLMEWEKSIEVKDWDTARTILHREKVMIKSIGINGFDGLISEIENDNVRKSESEMILMYTQLIDLFKMLQSRLSA